jgi:hypothetical protein
MELPDTSMCRGWEIKMNKKIISFWSLLSLCIFIICDILMSANRQDLLKTALLAAIVYVILIVMGLFRLRLSYHLLGVVIGIYTLSFFVMIKTSLTNLRGKSWLILIVALMGLVVNLLWYRIAAKQIKNDYIRIVAKNVKK